MSGTGDEMYQIKIYDIISFSIPILPKYTCSSNWTAFITSKALTIVSTTGLLVKYASFKCFPKLVAMDLFATT